ncbi:MAG: hypothetical protein GY816_13865 [Cytophagales bacterium]|nr:hypothetical protein [Cytophagales bacterium]
MIPEPILKINAIRSDDENLLAYKITISQGEEQITSEEDLLEGLKNTIPDQKGIVSTQQLSSTLWVIHCNK